MYRTLALVLLLLVGCAGSSPERTATETPPREVPAGGETEAADADPRYTLTLARRPPAGARWHEQVDYTGRTTIRGRERTRHYAIDARLTVTEAAADHDVLRVEIDEHLHRDWRSGERNRGLPPGTIVVVRRRHGGAHLERGDGTPLQQIFVQQLADVLELTLQEEGENDDAFFQTTEPRAVGERWSIASDYLTRSVDGIVDYAEATLERVETVDGVEQASLTTDVRAHTDHSATTIHYDLVIPTDPALPITRHHRRLEHRDETVGSQSVYETTRTRAPVEPNGIRGR